MLFASCTQEKLSSSDAMLITSYYSLLRPIHSLESLNLSTVLYTNSENTLSLNTIMANLFCSSPIFVVSLVLLLITVPVSSGTYTCVRVFPFYMALDDIKLEIKVACISCKYTLI